MFSEGLYGPVTSPFEAVSWSPTKTPVTVLPLAVYPGAGVMMNQAKPTTRTEPDPFSQSVPPLGSSTIGIRTSCWLLGSSRVAWPLAPHWTIWLTVSHVVMRLSMPWRVGPAFWPGLTSSCSPTLTGQAFRLPSISSR